MAVQYQYQPALILILNIEYLTEFEADHASRPSFPNSNPLTCLQGNKTGSLSRGLQSSFRHNGHLLLLASTRFINSSKQTWWKTWSHAERRSSRASESDNASCSSRVTCWIAGYGAKTLCIAYFLYRWLKRFQGTSTDGRSCLIGQIPAKRFLPQVSSRDIVAGLFSNITFVLTAGFRWNVKVVPATKT